MLELARLGAATRPGVDLDAVERIVAGLSHPDRVDVFAITPVDVSSSEIRARVASGEPIGGLVPPAVAAEIERLGLYLRAERRVTSVTRGYT